MKFKKILSIILITIIAVISCRAIASAEDYTFNKSEDLLKISVYEYGDGRFVRVAFAEKYKAFADDAVLYVTTDTAMENYMTEISGEDIIRTTEKTDIGDENTGSPVIYICNLDSDAVDFILIPADFVLDSDGNGNEEIRISTGNVKNFNISIGREKSLKRTPYITFSTDVPFDYSVDGSIAAENTGSFTLTMTEDKIYCVSPTKDGRALLTVNISPDAVKKAIFQKAAGTAEGIALLPIAALTPHPIVWMADLIAILAPVSMLLQYIVSLFN